MSVQVADNRSTLDRIYENYLEPHQKHVGSIKGFEHILKGVCIVASMPKVFPNLDEYYPEVWDVLKKVAQPLKEAMKFFSVVHLVNSTVQIIFAVISQNGKVTEEGQKMLRWLRESVTYGAELGIDFCKYLAWSYLGWTVLALGLWHEGKTLIQQFNWEHISHPLQMLHNDEVFATILGVVKSVTSIARQALVALGIAFGISLPALGVTWAMVEFGIRVVNWTASYVTEVRRARSKEKEKRLHTEYIVIHFKKERLEKEGKKIKQGIHVTRPTNAEEIQNLTERKEKILSEMNSLGILDRLGGETLMSAKS